MSEFDVAQYREIISKIENGIEKITSDFNTGAHRLEHDFGWIPLVGDSIKEGLEEAGKLLDEGVQKLLGLLESSDVPFVMWDWADSWRSMATSAGESASQLALIKRYADEWGGIAGGKYQDAVEGQEPAVDLIQSRANSMSGACRFTATAGFAFYMSLGVSVVGLGFVAASFAIAETGPPALLSFIGGLTAFILGVASAVATLLIGVDNQANTFRTLLEPTDTIPGGSWPVSAN